ncbi:TetR/AcrR family transcriptional regulator [Nocardioides alcanivorans]|uniref:TetR/AcrR family transcriptional regulator n=1 Tax=Nocardioides alcanivorans TaxID=2897352 RepID=UPI001F3E009F|nr:TetR/AcrR family transcriptional regulator [Nocardioides alcanivorans]
MGTSEPAAERGNNTREGRADGAATRALILAAAEQLFAVHGIEGVSTRRILKESGVNPAAIHYHFGSKHNLVDALLTTRIASLSEKQDQWLRKVETEEVPTPTAVIACFTRPIVEITEEPQGEFTVKFLAEAANHPDFMESYLDKSVTTVKRKAAAVARVTPGLTREQQVAWTRFATTLAFRTLGSRIYTSGEGLPSADISSLEKQVSWFLLLAIPDQEQDA